ncbi:DGK [Mytilus edulis]|uniref:DgkA n=1 Tax=Mytilus edulis TaxID=6550 RepID=A0A8S3TL32_MYTED|nr:DGK [Mytilus edulis]
MTFQWQKLSPTEFHQLQEYISYSSKKLKDVLEDLHISCDEPMVYDGFRKFMDSYMEAEIPEELCKHLFLSLMKKPIGPPTTTGKDYHHVRDVAAVTATQTVCAPITHLGADIHIDKGEKHQGFVEKIHGLTEKLQGLGLHGEKGHSRHDSGESGKRSRAEIGKLCGQLSAIEDSMLISIGKLCGQLSAIEDLMLTSYGSTSASTHPAVAVTVPIHSF